MGQVIFSAAMVMMLASSLTIFAKENEAVPRIVDNVMYVDEGSNNVWVYGVAVSIAGANKTDIVPNNPTTKIDVMANGMLTKQLDGVVLFKDDKEDRVFLEAGSTVIEAPAITDKALATLKKSIAAGKADSITAAQILGTTADKGALAYQISTDGKILTANGEDMAALLKTNANYKSVLAAYEEAAKAAEEATEESSKESADSNVPSDVSSGSGGYSGPEYTFVVSANNYFTKLLIKVEVNGKIKYDGNLAGRPEKSYKTKVRPKDKIIVTVCGKPEISEQGIVICDWPSTTEVLSGDNTFAGIDAADSGTYVKFKVPVDTASDDTYVTFGLAM